LRRTVTLINTTAVRTDTRSIARVNKFNYDPRQYRLVFDKATQLPECPRVMLPPLAMPNRDSVSYTAQIFNSDTSASVFSLCNNSLTDSVIDIGGKPPLFTRALLEKAFSCLRVLYLKFRSQLGLTLSETIDLITRISLTIRVGSDIYDAEVNPQIAIIVIGSRLRGIYNDSDVKDTITQNKVGLPDLAVNSGCLISTDACGYNLSTSQSQDRNFIQPLPRKDALVINHNRVRIKRMLDFPINFVALRGLSYCSHCHLCRQAKLFSEILIDKVVKVHLPKGITFKSCVGGIIASLVKSFHSLQQSFMLLWARGKLYHQGLLHIFIIEHFNLQCQVKEGAFPPPPKGGGLHAQLI